MECKESAEANSVSTENGTPKAFVFSKPNLLNPPKIINSGVTSNQAPGSVTPKKNVFTFAKPVAVSQPSNQNTPAFQPSISEKQHKSRITRNLYKPAVNVFAQALKDTAVFEQMKKNSRSQITKVNSENSITCTNVPQSLLTKVPAKEYFTQFGNIVKIMIRPKKQIITVTYATKEEANVAYSKCGEYLGEKFNVQWMKSCNSPKSPVKKKDLQKNIVSQIVSNFFKPPDDEVKFELDGMVNLEYNVHNRDNFDGTVQKKGKVKGTSKTSTRAEKAMKSEKLKSDSQISDLLPNATVEELQSIVQQPACTSEDKYKVLEARDRLIRMKQTKSHTLAAANVMIGTCPDMCPEKERLMREAKRQVAVYEQLECSEYKINHLKAVKQYSRSSADQEEPMAHELRPVKSLKMAMSYLLHEIANLCDQQGTNIGEWYHFLWDRTRGIRKDITQQELCCTDSVELVEQCARFHIVCSERLCAEEPSVFDKRINSDNLTKCLQSLKYMYHDLRVKGVSCKNEAEFRAYIILLNLNNGNFMWDLQRLPKNIQKSPEVRFALEVYFALESNDYYKFFNLVKRTTYLNACILLRYFNQIRLKALAVLVKAYCRTASTAYPLYELIDILGFENENEAIYFCEQLGLNISNDGLYVLLNRHNFTMPVLNIKQDRACNLIESKRTLQQLSIGECIAGGKMPEKSYKYHKPHNSFDSRGYLLLDSLKAEDQSKNIASITDPYEFKDEDTIKPKQLISASKKNQSNSERTANTDYANVFKSDASNKSDTNIITTVQSDNNISSSSSSETQTNASVASKPSKVEHQSEINIFGLKPKQQDTTSKNESKLDQSSVPCSTFGTTSENFKTSNIFSKQFASSSNNDAASPFLQTANKNLFSGIAQENVFTKSHTPSTIFSNRLSNEQAASTPPPITNLKTNTAENTSKDVQNVFLRPTKSQEKTLQEKQAEKERLKEEEYVKRMQQINETAEEVLNSLQTEIIETCCSDIVKDEIDRIRVYDTLSKDVSKEILNEIIHEMCDSVLKEEIINTRKIHEMSVKVKNKVIIKYINIWKFNTLKRKQQRKALENTPVWLQKYSTEQCAKLLYSKEQDLVIQSMSKKREEQKTVKSYSESLAPIEIIIYSGIKENLKSCDNVHSNYYWKLVISWPDLHNKPVLWHHKKIMNQYIYPNDYTVDPIIKLYRPNQIETLHICIRHFEGLISDYNLIGSDALLFITEPSEEIKFVIRRLTKTILSRDRLMPIPLVFIVLGDSNVEYQDTEIVSNLDKLLKSGYLSTYTIMYEKDLTEKTILNLTQSAMLWLSMNKSPQNPLEMDYLENIYDTCLTDELWLRIFDDTFFNEKLSRALKEPKFIIDLHNEAVTHIMDILLDPEAFMYTKFAPELKKFLKNQYGMPCSYEYFDDVWKSEEYKAELEKVMSTFKLPQWKYGWPINDSNTLSQKVINYCQETLSSNEISSGILNNLLFTPGMSTVLNFIDVLLYIVKKKLYLLEKDFKVVYNKNHIKHFRTLPWWLRSNLLTEYKFALEELDVKQNERKHKRESNLNEPTAKKRKVYQNDTECEPLATFCKNSQSQIMEVDCTSKKIEDRLKAHRQQSLLFEERLKDALLSEIKRI